MDSSERITIIFAEMASDARISLYINLIDAIGLTKAMTVDEQVKLCIEWGKNAGVEFLILDKMPDHGLPVYGLITDSLTLLKLF